MDRHLRIAPPIEHLKNLVHDRCFNPLREAELMEAIRRTMPFNDRLLAFDNLLRDFPSPTNCPKVLLRLQSPVQVAMRSPKPLSP